jgi:hypothetical protein
MARRGKKVGRPRVVRVVCRRVLARAHTYEDALVIAEKWVDKLYDWNRVEVSYDRQVDVPQAKKGPWAIEAVKDGGPNGEGLAPRGEKSDEDSANQVD